VQGLEENPKEVIDLVFLFYKSQKKYQSEEFLFQRYEKPDANVSCQPWYNKEIFMKLNKKEEGRDFDNRHRYPYICLQVRYDSEAREKVSYSWESALNYIKSPQNIK
jgi:hypothetical protein